MMARYTREIDRLIRNEKTHAAIIMMGARTPMRTIIWNEFCRLVTSVVLRVIIEPVEKRSIFVKLKPCTLANTSWRRFFAKPAEATAAKRPASVPAAKETSAHRNRIRPNFHTIGMEPPVMPWSMRFAMTVGMMISMIASTATVSGVRMLSFLYSRRLCSSVRMTCVGFAGASAASRVVASCCAVTGCAPVLLRWWCDCCG